MTAMPRGARWSWKPLVTALFVLPLGTCGACYGYQAWWWAGAEAAVRDAVAAVAAGRAEGDVTVRLDSAGALRPSIDFRQPYAIQGADNFLAGTGLADLVSPGIWVAHVKFEKGHEYHAEAQRTDGRWVVSFAPAEGQ